MANSIALAEQYTISPGMKSAQGNLGFIADFKYPVRYAEALDLGINQYSQPFPVGDNWAIVKLLDAKQTEAKTLEQVASQIRKKLSGRKLESSMKEWMESLPEKYKVEVDYDVIWESIDKNEYE